MISGNAKIGGGSHVSTFVIHGYSDASGLPDRFESVRNGEELGLILCDNLPYLTVLALYHYISRRKGDLVTL